MIEITNNEERANLTKLKEIYRSKLLNIELRLMEIDENETKNNETKKNG